MKEVLAICGSIKNTSANYTLLTTIQSLASGRFELEIYDGLSNLPYFDPNPNMKTAMSRWLRSAIVLPLPMGY